MSKITLGVYSYSGTILPKIFSGPKDKVEEAFRDYIEENPDYFDGDKYVKMSYNNLSTTSHKRDPISAAMECCRLLNSPVDNHQDDKEDVEETLDDIEDEENEPSDIEEEFDREEIDKDEVPNDRIIDDEIIVDDDWEGYEES